MRLGRAATSWKSCWVIRWYAANWSSRTLRPTKSPLLRQEAHSKLGQRDGEDGNGFAVGIQAHFVPVQGQGGLQAQGIPGAQTGRRCAQLSEAVPQPQDVLVAHEQLKAYRLAGVAGSGDLDGMTLHLQGVEVIFLGPVMKSQPERV